MIKENKQARLNSQAAYGAHCRQIIESQPFNNAFLEMKTKLLETFETIDSSDIEQLQEAHRTYKNLSKLQAYFEKHITRGDAALNRLNLSKQQG